MLSWLSGSSPAATECRRRTAVPRRHVPYTRRYGARMPATIRAGSRTTFICVCGLAGARHAQATDVRASLSWHSMG